MVGRLEGTVRKKGMFWTWVAWCRMASGQSWIGLNDLNAPYTIQEWIDGIR